MPRHASLPRWLAVARDCLGVRSQDVARAMCLRDAPAIVADAEALPSSDAVGAVAAAFARDEGAGHAHRVDVESVMGGDGSVDKNRLCAEVGQVYGSSQAVALYSMFMPIELDAELFDNAPPTSINLHTYAVQGHVMKIVRSRFRRARYRRSRLRDAGVWFSAANMFAPMYGAGFDYTLALPSWLAASVPVRIQTRWISFTVEILRI
eukprot:IDg3783t1